MTKEVLQSDLSSSIYIILRLSFPKYLAEQLLWNSHTLRNVCITMTSQVVTHQAQPALIKYIDTK